jgi:hypothetical protein
MRFYTGQHRHSCGIDLHTRTMYVCILDATGQLLVHRNLPAKPEAFLAVIAPYREDLVVAVECIFTWYWLADLCAKEGIRFVLGHALYMKAIHGGKAKNDKIDAHKIAVLLRGGMLPQAYVYPAGMRATRVTGVNCFFRSATIISAGGQSFRFRVLGGSELPARPEISAPARSLKAI